jgi:peptidoglycan/LPS O-acetylase OafA/YrhL
VSKALRMPGLDGLRAISIVMVLLGHLRGTQGIGRGALAVWLGDLAHLGVQVFFVISGFLITSLLLSEQKAAGHISLQRFYLRRSVRILPAFFAYLLAIYVAHVIGWIHLSPADMWTAATYTVNYHVDRSWYIGHMWSLSVEEQFYLLWPLSMVMVATKGGRIRIAAAVFLFAPLVRVAMHALIKSGPARDLEIFPAVADAIAAGCLMGILREDLAQREWYRKLTASRWIWSGALLILAIHEFENYTVVNAVGVPIELAIIAILIETSTRRSEGFAARLLNWRPVVFVGALSYSLYLWQQPFLNHQCMQVFCAFPLNLLLAVACALISHRLFEQPFVGLRRRFAAPEARGDANSAERSRQAVV